MDSLKQLTDTLDKLRTVSRNSIKTALGLLKSLSDNDSEMVEDIKYEIPGLDGETILEALSSTISELTVDSEKVSEEIDLFIKCILKGKNVLEERQSEYPFLFEVWSGDIYDNRKTAALTTLLGELQTQMINLNSDYISETSLQKLLDS